MPDTSTLAAPVEVVIDLETQGLRYEDDWWEVAAIVRRKDFPDFSYVWHNIDFDSSRADPEALRMSGYYDRHPLAVIAYDFDPLTMTPPDHPCVTLHDAQGKPLENRHVLCTDKMLAVQLERLTRGAVVWGCNPHYDLTRIERLFARERRAWTAHYRPMCATTYAAGVASGMGLDVGPVPYKNAAIGDLLGVDRSVDGKAHQGLADCTYALNLLDAARRAALEARETYLMNQQPPL